MSNYSKIAWTDATWQPVVGCSKVSPGCKNCYAETMANRQLWMEVRRFEKNTKLKHPFKYAKVIHAGTGKWNGKTFCDESVLQIPLKRKKPTMYFVCSMGDLFHESVPFEFIDKVFDVMLSCPQHTFQLLTKRPERALEYYDGVVSDSNIMGEPAMIDHIDAKHIWLGVTAENQEMWDKRKKAFLSIPAAIRFVSQEPCLSEIKYTRQDLRELHWLIVGAESGPGMRYMRREWAESTLHRGRLMRVPVFVKQIHLPGCRKCGLEPCTHLNGHKPKIFVSKDMAEWPEELRVQEYPKGRE